MVNDARKRVVADGGDYKDVVALVSSTSGGQTVSRT